jgi:NAD(P)-dependent dehydrogenase (short-subunit alcohol dehydrogenase family)
MKRRRHQAKAVVTGAGSGIGQAFAVELAARGSQVLCSDIDEAAAHRTRHLIEDQGGRAAVSRCDVSELAQVQQLAQDATDWFGRPPTLVINNAGVGAGGQSVGQTPIEDWDWTLGINLWGPIYGCHVFTPLLRQNGRGGIINVASAASFGAAPGMAAYNVSKAGVLSLSETLAAELAGTKIAVTVVCPTFVKTNIVESGRITAESSAAARRLMQYTGMSPRRVARIALNANDHGRLYAIPQLDAKLGWQIKRTVPEAYTKAIGTISRFGPMGHSDTRNASTSTAAPTSRKEA